MTVKYELSILLIMRIIACLILFAISTFSSAKTTLAPCPSSPNCVSSLEAESDDRYIASLPHHDLVLDKIRDYIASQKRWQLVSEQENYLHAIYKSALFGFIDDIEFLIIKKTLHVRSASRAGYYDFGANRARVERIREFLK